MSWIPEWSRHVGIKMEHRIKVRKTNQQPMNITASSRPMREGVSTKTASQFPMLLKGKLSDLWSGLGSLYSFTQQNFVTNYILGVFTTVLNSCSVVSGPTVEVRHVSLWVVFSGTCSLGCALLDVLSGMCSLGCVLWDVLSVMCSLACAPWDVFSVMSSLASTTYTVAPRMSTLV